MPGACPSHSEARPPSFCPLCHHAHFARRHARVPTIVTCGGCGLVSRQPQPSDAELAAIYDDGYFFGSGTHDRRYEAEFARLKRATAAAYLDRIERYAGWNSASRRGKRLLEVGPGLGDLLIEAADRGYQIAGIEYSPSSASRANERIGRPVVLHGTIDAMPDQAGFDVCVLSDVIEHTRDPVRVLSRAHDSLGPGGVIFVATPSLDSWSARVLGARWMEFKDEHLFFFDRATLESSLVRTGFQSVRLSNGFKTLSLGYVAAHFERFRVPMLSAMVRWAAALVPGTIRRRPMRIVASGVDALARRAKDQPIDRRRARLSVVMPVYNERSTFATVVDQVLQKELPGTDIEVVIVESQSTDGTMADVTRVESHPRVKVIWQERPQGKGNAVRAGLAAATGDFVLIQDADLEYDVADYGSLVEPLRTFRRAFVLGIRHGKGGHTWKVRHFTDRVLLGHWMNVGHLIFTTLFNVVYGQRLSDPFTMFKVFRRECLSGLIFEANRFDFDWELVGKFVRCGYRPLEVPVNYRSRSFSEGKKVTMIRDPLTWIRACFKFRFVALKHGGPGVEPGASLDNRQLNARD